MPCDRFTIAFDTSEMLKSMFSSSIARLNLFAFEDAVSRCSRETKFLHCVCVRDSTGSPRSIVNLQDAIIFTLHRFPVLSEESSSSCKHLPTISCEQDVFSCSTSFPVRSKIGLGLDWVGLEDSARGASPKDC